MGLPQIALLAMAKKTSAAPAKSAKPGKTQPTVAVGERAKPATPPSAPSRHLDVFPNPAPERDYVIQIGRAHV